MTSVFFGTSAFAVPSLHALAGRTRVLAVVSQPDRPSGRGQRLQASPVKAAAVERGIDVLAPERMRDAIDDLRSLGADIFVVASYGKILPQAVLDLPRGGAFNVHPSLLPLYRGATPLQAQIRDMRAEAGVTIIAMDAGMDTGDILVQERSALGARETYGELHDRLAADGARLLIGAIDLAEAGTLTRTPQAGLASAEEIEATLTRPLGPDDLRLDWNAPAARVDALVRSLAPLPLARASIADLSCKIASTRLASAEEIERFRPHDAGASGAFWPGAKGADDALFVGCGEGAVAIVRIVPPNRSAMSGAAFGASLLAGSRQAGR